MIKADYVPNKIIAVNKSNAQHNEIKTRLTVAKKTNALHLNQMNINHILPEVYCILYLNVGICNEKSHQT